MKKTFGFEEMCSYVGLPHTKRQLHKWESKRGMAYRASIGHVVIPIPKHEEIFPADRRAIANRQLSTAGQYDGGM